MSPPLPGARIITLRYAIDTMIAAKATANYRGNYVKGLEQYLNQFAAGRENILLKEIDEITIEEWFKGRREALSTVKSNLGRFAALFKFAWKRRWIEQNPIERVEKPRLDQNVPAILTVRQSAKVLVFTKRKRSCRLAWVTLVLLAGLRPNEALKITWSDIDLNKHTVRVSPQASKTRQRRIVHLMPAAVAWLKMAKAMGACLPTPATGARRWRRQLRDMLKLRRWSQDILRHTCASYWLAWLQDAGKVAHELGNSAGMLLRFYRELVTREEAERFWNLAPDPEKAAQRRFAKRLAWETRLPQMDWFQVATATVSAAAGITRTCIAV